MKPLRAQVHLHTVMTGVSARHDIRSRRELATYRYASALGPYCYRLLHICGPSMHIILSDGDTLTYPDLILDLMPRTSD